MTRRMIDIDDAKLAAAREALGTSTIKATVEEALDQAVWARRVRQRASLAELASFDWPDDPDHERGEMWGAG
ncbi:MAG: type II toxin-antitoxin system VapB family antitoxin [Sporichthyaceae bacterium]